MNMMLVVQGLYILVVFVFKCLRARGSDEFVPVHMSIYKPTSDDDALLAAAAVSVRFLSTNEV